MKGFIMKRLVLLILLTAVMGCTTSDWFLGNDHNHVKTDTVYIKPDTVIAVPIDSTECHNHHWNGEGFGHEKHEDCEE